MFRSSPRLILALCGLLATCGCAPFVPRSQLTAAQTQCRRLNEQVMAQQGEIAGLNTHRREVEDPLRAAHRFRRHALREIEFAKCEVRVGAEVFSPFAGQYHSSRALRVQLVKNPLTAGTIFRL